MVFFFFYAYYITVCRSSGYIFRTPPPHPCVCVCTSVLRILLRLCYDIILNVFKTPTRRNQMYANWTSAFFFLKLHQNRRNNCSATKNYNYSVPWCREGGLKKKITYTETHFSHFLHFIIS